jgi:hypothetical protein
VVSLAQAAKIEPATVKTRCDNVIEDWKKSLKRLRETDAKELAKL